MEAAHEQSLFLYHWLQQCEKENIILCFQGDFNQDLVNAILLLTESGPDIQNSTTVVRARVFSVLVECMQNIRKYGAPTTDTNDLKPGIVIVCVKNNNYVLKTGNFVVNSEVPALKAKLDGLLKLDKEELKALHKKVLNETELSEKSGAGLGLIAMARKADGFAYSFKALPGDVNFYSLDINILNSSKN